MGYNEDLQDNNGDLEDILAMVNALPEAGGSEWEEVISFTTTEEAIEFFINITDEQKAKIQKSMMMTFEAYVTASEDAENVTTNGKLSAWFYSDLNTSRWNNGTLLYSIANSIPDAITSWKKWVRTVGVYYVNMKHSGVLSAPVCMYMQPQNQSISYIVLNTVNATASINSDFHTVKSLHILGTQPIGIGSSFKLYVR